MQDLMIYKDNHLIEASYKLSLYEQRVMLFCIGKLSPTNPQQRQVIRVDDFLKQFPEVNRDNAYKYIKNAIDNLYDRTITVKNPKSVEKFRWVQYVKYTSDEGAAVVEFSNAVMPYLCQLEEQFTKYHLRHVSAFKRTYSIRLYELLTQYRNIKKRTLTLEELRVMLDLGNKFQEINNLKARVINPAIDEINTKSDLKVSYTQNKRGRVVESLEFEIKVNEQIEMFEKQAKGKKELEAIKKKLKL